MTMDHQNANRDRRCLFSVVCCVLSVVHHEGALPG